MDMTLGGRKVEVMSEHSENAQRVLLLLCSHETEECEAVSAGARLSGFESLIVQRPRDALRAMALRPTVAMFPLNAERVDGVRFERALHAANPAVPIVGVGPTVRASIVCRLLSVGVASYLDRPVTAEEVAAELKTLSAGTDILAEAVRATVGVRDLKDMQRWVRFTMCAEALQRVRGSRRGAARLLGVDRRAVQKLVEQMQDSEASGEHSADEPWRAAVRDL